MEGEAEVKDESLSPGCNEDRECLVKVGLFLLKKGNPPLLHNPSFPHRMVNDGHFLT